MGEGFVTLAVVLAMVIGIVFGIAFGRAIERSRKTKAETKGLIYVYRGDDVESAPSLFLEPNVPIEDIASEKRVTFNVVVTR